MIQTVVIVFYEGFGDYFWQRVYPVVSRGKAQIRTQISAAHKQGDLEMAVKAFIEVKQQLELWKSSLAALH